ncbi:uncharacterized protein Z518_03513 [Rhinocladiella mackenziei CBS 650.93]|uniref:VOC domain-containing protein n=1 Tax=Rhinocladiella mackenziei CBS 650.93 TaxID=1442369 RepID=A0A0D2IZL4_9EURO|nr:uncharacterized protein Z518_03513 [Rhinocladiella mackenziei CBS 650.93]KIX08856.1 hypothetical protein Z518_03513 [Rhinocladiella mackenziei CBS 650.93]
MPPILNANFNHVAVSVPDADAAVAWYTELFGFRVISPVYGPEFKAMKIALLSCGNGVGFEIFEFPEPKYSGPHKRIDWGPETYTKGGYFHLCLTVPNVEEKVKEAVKKGASVVGEMDLAGGERTAYLQDPWGNVVELLSLTFDQLFLKFKDERIKGTLVVIGTLYGVIMPLLKMF